MLPVLCLLCVWLTARATIESDQSIVSLNSSSIVPSGDAGNHTEYFYMYDLPEEFWWRWPVNGTEKVCTENGYLSNVHAEYSGIGVPIIPEDGLFLTWHFSMFSSLYNRFKRSSRRTKDPSKASMFIIPYDLGLDGYLDPNTCANRRSCTNGLVGKLRIFLAKMPYFARNNGADHVLLWSLGQYHPWPRSACDTFMMQDCAKCTLSCYWMDHTKAENRFVSMPFPAAYHYWDGIKNLPWNTSLASQRNMTAVYLGSTLTLNPWHTKIRRAMAAQCNVSVHCHWKKIAHSSIDNSIGDLLSVYKKAVFCLCPPGDDPARKAVFDAIVSGCIPVIFEVATLYNQYPWHIGEQAALDVSVYIPGGAMRSGKIDFMSVLMAIPSEVIRKKQQALAELAPRVQYAIPPYHLLRDKYDETPWDPPFKDAAEIALDGFFERTYRVVHNESTKIPHRLRTGREWGDDYNVVKIQEPQGPLRFGWEPNNGQASSSHLSSGSFVTGTKATTGHGGNKKHHKVVSGKHAGEGGKGHHGAKHHRGPNLQDGPNEDQFDGNEAADKARI